MHFSWTKTPFPGKSECFVAVLLTIWFVLTVLLTWMDSLMSLCMFLMFFYKSEKHVFMFFYLQINVFNVYVLCYTIGTVLSYRSDFFYLIYMVLCVCCVVLWWLRHSGLSDGQHWSVSRHASPHERPREAVRLVRQPVPLRLLVRVCLGHVHTARPVRAHVPSRVRQAQEGEGAEWTRGCGERASSPRTHVILCCSVLRGITIRRSRTICLKTVNISCHSKFSSDH